MFFVRCSSLGEERLEDFQRRAEGNGPLLAEGRRLDNHWAQFQQQVILKSVCSIKVLCHVPGLRVCVRWTTGATSRSPRRPSACTTPWPSARPTTPRSRMSYGCRRPTGGFSSSRPRKSSLLGTCVKTRHLVATQLHLLTSSPSSCSPSTSSTQVQGGDVFVDQPHQPDFSAAFLTSLPGRRRLPEEVFQAHPALLAVGSHSGMNRSCLCLPCVRFSIVDAHFYLNTFLVFC